MIGPRKMFYAHTVEGSEQVNRIIETSDGKTGLCADHHGQFSLVHMLPDA